MNSNHVTTKLENSSKRWYSIYIWVGRVDNGIQGRLKTMREAVQRKLQNSEEVRLENELKRDTLKSQLIALEKES